MTLDPQVQALLEQMALIGGEPLHTLSPEAARTQSLARRAQADPAPVGGGVQDREIPGPLGPIPVRIYRSGVTGTTAGLVAFHAGGWVLGDLDSQDALCRSLCNMTGFTIVGVNYRHAPETKFPGAAEDAYAATKWVSENAAELGIDPARLGVFGESAGGNLAAVVCLMARDRGGPAISHQTLLYMVADSDFERPSYRENAEGYLLTSEGMAWFWRHYMNDPAEYSHPYAAPVHAPDLSGLPPAHIITAEYDPLRDEGAAFADRLRDAGVNVQYSCYPGMVHMFISMFALLDKGRAGLDEVVARLKARLGRAP